MASDDVDVELDALQEQAGRRVGVLVGLHHVAARVGDERADRGDDPGSIGALQEENGPHGAVPQNSFRSGSTSPRNRARFTSTHATPLLSAYTRACGLICWATSMPAVGANCGSRSSRS